MGRQAKCDSYHCTVVQSVGLEQCLQYGLSPGGPQPLSSFFQLLFLSSVGRRLSIVEVLCATHMEPDSPVGSRFGMSLASQADEQAPAMSMALQVLTDRPQTLSKDLSLVEP